MDFTATLLDILKFAIGALVVFVIVKDIMKSYFEYRSKLPLPVASTLSKSDDAILPLRLQAYERMALYCERIAPENLLMRVRPEGINVAEYKLDLMLSIRQEYEHNVTQQIYISAQLWQIIKLAGEDTIGLIALAADGIESKADARQLYEAIYSLSAQRGSSGSEKALQALKTEVASIMG